MIDLLKNEKPEIVIDLNKNTEIEELAINTIRALSMDGVQKANSGHPGTPMALAPLAYELFQNTMAYDPDNAHWANRDRFILSNGHASMLLYSMIHLTNIRQLDKSGKKTGKPALGLGDLKKFRQLSILLILFMKIHFILLKIYQ